MINTRPIDSIGARVQRMERVVKRSASLAEATEMDRAQLLALKPSERVSMLLALIAAQWPRGRRGNPAPSRLERVCRVTTLRES